MIYHECRICKKRIPRSDAVRVTESVKGNVTTFAYECKNEDDYV